MCQSLLHVLKDEVLASFQQRALGGIFDLSMPFFRISFVVAGEVSPFPRRPWVLVTGAISFQSF